MRPDSGRTSVHNALAISLRARAAAKLVEAMIFRTLSRRARRMAAERGIRSTDRLFGLQQTHHITEAYVVGVMNRLRPGTDGDLFSSCDGYRRGRRPRAVGAARNRSSGQRHRARCYSGARDSCDDISLRLRSHVI